MLKHIQNEFLRGIRVLSDGRSIEDQLESFTLYDDGLRLVLKEGGRLKGSISVVLNDQSFILSLKRKKSHTDGSQTYLFETTSNFAGMISFLKRDMIEIGENAFISSSQLDFFELFDDNGEIVNNTLYSAQIGRQHIDVRGEFDAKIKEGVSVKIQNEKIPFVVWNEYCGPHDYSARLNALDPFINLHELILDTQFS